ncbi:MAG: HAD-IIA family hydrolase [Trueperaceae bacterium]|nr:HAD-IIA family hydrolase [Trueperaceae bacterium]
MSRSESTPGSATSFLRGIRSYLFDLDGCLWFGDVLADGATELVRDLRDAGLSVGFLTNASVASGAELAAKLTRLGIPATAEQVLAPLDVVADHDAVRDSQGAFVLGTGSVAARLRERGVPVVSDPAQADVVVVGKDTNATYRDLAAATHALRLGARLVALNLDASVPAAGGRREPGVGAIVAALTTASGVAAASVGKPSALFFQVALQRFAMSPERTVMVGDTPETDVRGGRAAGLRTVLLRPGTPDAPESRGGERDAADEPDLQVPDLHALRRMLLSG